ncbi:MAG TPA: 4Fe-4S binding protein [Spirochaetota bacterium]|nr:4Fe-4S binding protein [Spirochaetota bacterium]
MKFTGLKKLSSKWLIQLRYRKTYGALRKHLAAMPVGMPPTPGGVEKRLLAAMFRPDEARLALCMTWNFEDAGKIAERAASMGFSTGDVETRLSQMDGRGSIFTRERDGRRQYALAPFVVGMFEMQGKKLTPALYLDTREYFLSGFALEYLTTARPQMRVIPVEKSVTPELDVATYDEIRNIVAKAGNRVAVAECICKKGHDHLGDPCRVTDEREVCLVLNDFHDQCVRNGWARKISTKKAMEIHSQCEKDGLVLQPSNMQHPDFVCACCKCCCGIMETFSSMPRPSDFIASNFMVKLDAELCNGCGKCVRRCQMDALHLKDKKVVLEEVRCIGCGLCVTTCKRGALRLEKRAAAVVPPRDYEDLFSAIMQGKKSAAGRLMKGIRGLVR